MTRPIDELTESVRRALALRASLETLGFPAGQIGILAAPGLEQGLARILADLPPPGAVIAAYVLDPTDATHVFTAAAGTVDDADAWFTTGRVAALAAWNALTPDERSAERRRWVPRLDFVLLVAGLIERGFAPPAVDPAHIEAIQRLKTLNDHPERI